MRKLKLFIFCKIFYQRTSFFCWIFPHAIGPFLLFFHDRLKSVFDDQIQRLVTAIPTKVKLVISPFPWVTSRAKRKDYWGVYWFKWSGFGDFDAGSILERAHLVSRKCEPGGWRGTFLSFLWKRGCSLVVFQYEGNLDRQMLVFIHGVCLDRKPHS